MSQKDELNVAQKAKVHYWSMRLYLYCIIILSLSSLLQSSLESQLKEMNTKLEEEVSVAAKAAKREAAKLQQRVREYYFFIIIIITITIIVVLASGYWLGNGIGDWNQRQEWCPEEFEEVTRKLNFNCFWLHLSFSFLLRSDRRYKEAVSQVEEEKANAQRLQDQVNSLNTKVRNLRRDKEDAESEVESIQKKLRQAKSQLEEAEEESSSLKAQVSKLRSGAGAARKAKVMMSSVTMLMLLFFFFLSSSQRMMMKMIELKKLCYFEIFSQLSLLLINRLAS